MKTSKLFWKQEWSDYNTIEKSTREELYWLIYHERTIKLLLLIFNVILAIILSISIGK